MPYKDKKRNNESKRKYQNSEKGRLKNLDYGLKRRYGLSLEEYKYIFSEQGGVCAICGKEGQRLHKSERKIVTEIFLPLVVDHCHKTGRVRGLLCNSCNAGIGMLKEDTSILSSSISYLTKFIEP